MAGLTDIPPPVLEAGRDALFLDLDGTLAEIADDPARVRMDQHVANALRDIARAGAVAVLTGRRVVDADRILGGAVGAIAGLHGLERRVARDAEIQAPVPLTALRAAADVFTSAIARGAVDARLEDKGVSVALHFRHAPTEAAKVLDLVRKEAARRDLRALCGKMVVELLPPGVAKGDALRDFMQIAPFAGRRPIMAGDDITDESAFDAANAFGGISVLVGPSRETAARYRLESVAAVGAWLARALETAR